MHVERKTPINTAVLSPITNWGHKGHKNNASIEAL